MTVVTGDPIAQTGQVGHILRAAASAAPIGELAKDGDTSVGDMLIERHRFSSMCLAGTPPPPRRRIAPHSS
ncbi:hypothetical protein ABZ639_16700 [Saccharomonospora sp. NPDC006951]